MPNWCENKTFIYGEIEEVTDFMSPFADSDVFHPMYNFCILENYHPCPESFMAVSGIVYPDDPFPESWNDFVASGDWTQEYYDARVAEFIAEKEIASQNMKQYNYISSTEWAIDNWGSKWGMCNTFCDGVSYASDSLKSDAQVMIDYETAWGPILKGIEYVSSLFPKLTFHTFYQEHGLGFTGIHKVVNGETIMDHCADIVNDSSL